MTERVSLKELHVLFCFERKKLVWRLMNIRVNINIMIIGVN